MRLKDKVALISGGARGIGAATARLFAREGAKVAVADIREEMGRKVVNDIVRETGGQAIFVKLDVTGEPDWESAIRVTTERFGRLDVLMNNAAVYSAVGIESFSTDEWDRVMAVNVKGVFLGTKHVIPVMRESGGGSIVNMSSIAGIVGFVRGGPYGASKAGVRLLTKYTAVQHASDGIRANSIHPGPIDTDMIAASIGTPEGRAASISRIPMGRIGSVDDVAYGALFLASDESSFMTGAELVIDGGLTAQ